MSGHRRAISTDDRKHGVLRVPSMSSCVFVCGLSCARSRPRTLCQMYTRHATQAPFEAGCVWNDVDAGINQALASCLQICVRSVTHRPLQGSQVSSWSPCRRAFPVRGIRALRLLHILYLCVDLSVCCKVRMLRARSDVRSAIAKLGRACYPVQSRGNPSVPALLPASWCVISVS